MQKCYKYKDGRFLKTSYIGDGDYELILANEISSDCIFPVEWKLSEILGSCDGIYNEDGEYLHILKESDFTCKNIKISIED